MIGMIGEIRIFAGTFAPRSWAFCEGQLLAITSNEALFSILGTTYGGDGRTTFGLPDLRGRAATQQGSGPGLPTYSLGQKTGTSNNTITVNNLPSHGHTGTGAGTLRLGAGGATSTTGANNSLASSSAINIFNAADPNASTKLQGSPVTTTISVGNSGGSQPINNMMPSLAIYFIICLQGVYPSRN